MLSRRYLWLLIAIPIALIALYFVRYRTPAPADQTAVPTLNIGPGIIYLSPASGPADLYYLNPEDNLPPTRLTVDADARAFDIAPDGSSLVFSAPNTDDSLDLWRLDLGNGFVNLLHNCQPANCTAPAFSPDGQWLAYQRIGAVESASQIWLLNLGSAEAQRASPDGQSARDPDWSPDGRLSYYNAVVAAYETIVPGGATRTRYPNETGAFLTWAPDGESCVAAESFPASSNIPRGPRGEDELATPDPTNEAPVEVLISALLRYQGDEQSSLFNYSIELIEDASPAISPDGAYLAFTRKYLDESRWTPGRQLWMLDLETREIGQITNEPNYQVASLAWSSDGSHLAYTRTNQTDFSTFPEVWMITASGTNATGANPRLLALDAYAPQWLS
ncbi:MAG TPA: hypothetical protein VF982_06175 [Anaerolineales bacterium]